MSHVNGRAEAMTAALLAAVLLVGGCGEHEDTRPGRGSSASAPSPERASSPNDVGTLARLHEDVRYVVWETPRQMLADQAVGLVGVVEDVVEGRSLISESEPYPTRDNSVVVRVRVSRTFKDPQSRVEDGTAYVSLPRGINALNPDGTIRGEDPNPSLDEVRRALPAGLRVLVVSQPEDRDLPLRNPAVSVGDEPHPLPSGAVLLTGMHPQTFVVDRGDQALESWPKRTFADVVAELDAG